MVAFKYLDTNFLKKYLPKRTMIRIGLDNTSYTNKRTSTDKSIRLSVVAIFFNLAFNFGNTILSSRIFLMVVIAFIV
tara:strand:- start:1217 stop:1447 length:231 start_codon:yes stop_codon:yes gene_type:complete